MPTILLDGTITATSPIAIILPASEDGRTEAGAPRKRLLRDGVLVETVFVPPSSLRGRLRHLLTREAMRMQRAKDPKKAFTPEDYIDTALGGVKDRKKAGEDDREVPLAAIRALRERNPIVSMFGSMVSKVAGRLVVGDMTPIQPIMPVSTGRSVRANPFVRDPAILEILDPAKFAEFSVRNAKRTEANRIEDKSKERERDLRQMKRKGAPPEDIEEVHAEVETLKADAKAAFEAAGGAVNLQQLLNGYDVIPEGAAMSNRIRLVDGTATEATMLLLALDLLAKRPLIGGHTAHGCGEITGSWDIRIQDSAGVRPGGRITIEPYAGIALHDGDSAIAEALNRAHSFESEVDKYDFGSSD
jgi:CRISPR/Cas system CSM-associated protein Csm3 (group 7 of RAMP superfamily)